MKKYQKASSPEKSKANKGAKSVNLSKRFSALADKEIFEFLSKLLTKMLKKEKKSKRTFSNQDYEHVFQKLKTYEYLGLDYAMRAEMLITAAQYFLDAQTLAAAQKNDIVHDKKVKTPKFMNTGYINYMLDANDAIIEMEMMKQKNGTNETSY
jgi:hypothetical protein